MAPVWSWSTPEYPRNPGTRALWRLRNEAALALRLLRLTRGAPRGSRWLEVIARYQLGSGGRPQLADARGTHSQRAAARALRTTVAWSVLAALLGSCRFVACGWWGDAKPGGF